ncbi:MAG: class I SAM-dependent methyltransferase [Maricaulaceae bacterium]
MTMSKTSAAATTAPPCRHCGAPMTVTLADLGMSPVANDLVALDKAADMEPFYPLEVLACSDCRLAQTRDFKAGDEIFTEDYVYFSSMSTSWLEHAKRYVDAMFDRFGFDESAKVVEIASNDGYLLKNIKDRGASCLGVEPCQSVALEARRKGIDTRIEFFGVELAQALVEEGWSADLIPANNVFAHVPDINDFTAGLATLLKPEGVITIEVQHLLRLMQRNQFDTIYHEHFSYLSLHAGMRIFASHGLRVFDVEEPPTHGGSIRFFVCKEGASHVESPNVARVLAEEAEYGLGRDNVYLAWQEQVKETKRALLELLIKLKREGATIAGYGAPAKGNTLLNYCGIGKDFIDFTVDKAPSKQDKLLPGSRIPILAPEAIYSRKPDYVLILPWNLKDEIIAQMSDIRQWGGKFITPIPHPKIYE